MAARRSEIAINRLYRTRCSAVACDQEERADDRQIFQRIDNGSSVFRRRLIPEIMKIERRDGDGDNQQYSEEPGAEIECDHQSADDFKGADPNGEHLWRRHSGHRLEL